MSNKGAVFVNGRAVIVGAGDGMAMAPVDVCKTPVPGGPPVPIPYPNVAKFKQITQGDKSRKIDSSQVMTQATVISSSSGGEPGTLGGVVSSASGGKTKALSWSMTVKVGGKGVVRHLDATMQNGK
jgi:hypothetical protein